MSEAIIYFNPNIRHTAEAVTKAVSKVVGGDRSYLDIVMNPKITRILASDSISHIHHNLWVAYAGFDAGCQQSPFEIRGWVQATVIKDDESRKD